LWTVARLEHGNLALALRPLGLPPLRLRQGLLGAVQLAAASTTRARPRERSDGPIVAILRLAVPASRSPRADASVRYAPGARRSTAAVGLLRLLHETLRAPGTLLQRGGLERHRLELRELGPHRSCRAARSPRSRSQLRSRSPAAAARLRAARPRDRAPRAAPAAPARALAPRFLQHAVSLGLRVSSLAAPARAARACRNISVPGDHSMRVEQREHAAYSARAAAYRWDTSLRRASRSGALLLHLFVQFEQSVRFVSAYCRSRTIPSAPPPRALDRFRAARAARAPPHPPVSASATCELVRRRSSMRTLRASSASWASSARRAASHAAALEGRAPLNRARGRAGHRAGAAAPGPRAHPQLFVERRNSWRDDTTACSASAARRRATACARDGSSTRSSAAPRDPARPRGAARAATLFAELRAPATRCSRPAVPRRARAVGSPARTLHLAATRCGLRAPAPALRRRS